MKIIEPSNPCFLFNNPNTIPESKNNAIEISWIIYSLILIDLLYCNTLSGIFQGVMMFF